MEMKQCAQGGHYYDAAIHHECPYCNNAIVGVTMPLDPNRTMQQGGVTQPRVGDEKPTVAIIQEKTGIDPVVGWLVSIGGTEKGRDYRIHTDNNFIGRGEEMDIRILGDDTISRENHAVISYDPRENLFYFAPGGGRSIVRLNEKPVLTTVEINAYDIVEIGKTKLVFLPLCGEKFMWE